jgi:hypothetical protein
VTTLTDFDASELNATTPEVGFKLGSLILQHTQENLTAQPGKVFFGLGANRLRCQHFRLLPAAPPQGRGVKRTLTNKLPTLASIDRAPKVAPDLGIPTVKALTQTEAYGNAFLSRSVYV